MSRWSLRRRLVAVLIGLLVAMAVAMGLASGVALQRTLVDTLDQRLEVSRDIGVRAQEGGPRGEPGGPFPGDDAGPGLPGRPRALEARGVGPGTLTAVVDGDQVTGGYLDDSGDPQQLTTAQADELASVEPDGEPRTVGIDGLGRYRVLATTTDDGAVLVTGLPTDDVQRTVADYVTDEVLIALVGIALAAVAGEALVRRELRPLERVAATATRVSELPLHQGEVALVERVPARDTDPATEVGQVGLALNRLLGHVEGALAARHASETQVRQFVADASHELRTPLASIRGYAELVRRLPADLPPDALRAMERVESESRRMTVLVEDMLLLARLDAGRPLEHAEVDLTALAVDAVADAHAAGPDHRWLLELPEPGDYDDLTATLVVGDEDRLRQVLVNLLANARVHTPAGTTVLTSVRPDDDAVVLQVRDDGPGIPEELRSQLFQRFTRGDAARSPGSGSSGLGLAIVDAVVRAHGGRIEVDGTPGATAFRVTLPAATAPA